jgi:autotransporter-associated beta strand protein
MRWGFCLLALGCWQPTEATPEFTLELSGAVTLKTAGRVEHGSAGTASEPYYTITLGGRDGEAAVVFTRRTPVTVTAGRYLVGEGQLANDGFGALIITGPPSHPTGVFQVQHGVLRLNRSGPAQLTGEFELHAAGFLSESPEQDDWQVTAKGRFAAPANERADSLGLNGAGSR